VINGRRGMMSILKQSRVIVERAVASAVHSG